MCPQALKTIGTTKAKPAPRHMKPTRTLAGRLMISPTPRPTVPTIASSGNDDVDGKAIHHRVAEKSHGHHDEEIRRVPESRYDGRRVEGSVQVHRRPVRHRALTEHVREGNGGQHDNRLLQKTPATLLHRS